MILGRAGFFKQKCIKKPFFNTSLIIERAISSFAELNVLSSGCPNTRGTLINENEEINPPASLFTP